MSEYKKSQGKRNRQWGTDAEEIARDHLLLEGYTIRETNWKVGNTIEIDIIAQKEDVISFVEVKARKGDAICGEDAIDQKKMMKMIKGGDIYLRSLPRLFKYSLDIIIVTGTKESHTIKHYKDAFLPPLL